MDTDSKSGSAGAMVVPPPSRWLHGKRYRIAAVATDLLLFLIGCVISLFANLSPELILLTMVFFAAGVGVLLVPRLGGLHERRIFTRVFLVGFVMAGVSAVYRNVLGDLHGDAFSFYQLASGVGTDFTIESLTVIHEGALAIVLWRAVYDFVAIVGFSREPYVGILVNVTAVAFTSVIALKMARKVYGRDPYRFQRLTLLFAACGLFWLFAGIHLRDAVLLLAVTALAYAWLHFLARPDLGVRLLHVLGASVLGALFFGLLRSEFVFVPTAMAMAGVGALMFGRKVGRNRLIAYVLVMIGLGAASVLLVTFGEAIQIALRAGQEGYLEHASAQHGEESLGMALILNQPAPVRLVLGSIYLFVFPIPFWSGFQLESAYHLFKSFNVLFFYFLIPVLALSVRQLWRDRASRSPALLFILFLSLGVTLAVAGTSLETRHFGAFFAPLFVLALLPDFRIGAVAKLYRRLVVLILGGVLVVHAVWIALKVA